jgi:6-phosphogluconolactonase (cycloisomerase 2 family)
MPRKHRITLLIVLASWLPTAYASENFVAFESEQFRPLSVSPDGQTLYAVNTPDNRIEVYSLSSAGLKQHHRRQREPRPTQGYTHTTSG